MFKLFIMIKKLQTDGTFLNFVVKSTIGFMSGILLTKVIFLVFLLQLNYSYTKATILSSFIGILLSIGLAFSTVCRCVFFMVLPQLFSDRGRYALIFYVFYLSISGPSKNTLHNTGVLSESLTCLQDEIKSVIRHIQQIIKKPLLAIRTSILKIKLELAVMIEKLKKGMLAVKTTVGGIVRTIKLAYEWLYSVMNMCNKKIGTPFQRCTKVFDNALEDCKVSVPSAFNWMCSISFVISHVCYSVKFLDSLCEFFEFINESIFGAIRASLKSYVRHMKNMFYVSVEFKHSFAFDSTPSKMSSDVIRGVITEFKNRIENAVFLFDLAGTIFSFFFLYIIFKTLLYRHKFLTSDSFDNKYLTEELYELDERKYILEQPTIMPLTRFEKNRYIERMSIRLIPKERKMLFKSLAVLLLTTFKICVQMAVDYSLYWILITVRKYGRISSQLDSPSVLDVNIEGDGILADLYKTIIHTFRPIADKMDMDTMKCLPNPLTPDFYRYRQICVVLLLLWFLALIQPYGLRFRSYVMGYYHPDIAMTRAVWLHNRVLRRRISFVTFARRFLRRKFGLSETVNNSTNPSCLDYMYSKFPFFEHIWRRNKQYVCLLCGYKAKGNDFKTGNMIKCFNEGCKGIYCHKCFADIDNRCTLCKKPIDYGDMTDISEEKDSSDEKQNLIVGNFSRRKKNFWKVKNQIVSYSLSKKSLLHHRGDSGDEGDDESSSDDSIHTSSTESNSYENNPNYVNAPLNCVSMILYSKNSSRQEYLV
ncbi:DC-STAMP domain-containing protein 2-like [Daktulosphaira vitifoliae]|uniref:DC-STAMP domain-containing protein 2-like n=1 Tax=Daktulosphaira vitifoliae TaxID=58002 RepID=UPI0021A98E3D|nr:DC-STAMP domain-containing protein 2-like [Daktulosphaira vitifoliae]